MRRQSWTAHGLIGLFLVLYAVSLYLPGIVFVQPDLVRENVRVERAVEHLKEGAACWTRPGTPLKLDPEGSLVDDQGAKLAPSQQISCWGNTTVTTKYGYDVLREGWKGIFIGVFAWYANLPALAAFAVAMGGKAPRAAAGFAGAAFLLGLDAYRFHVLPEVFSYGPMLDKQVLHLSSGYYVWEASLLVLLLSQIVTIRDRRAAREPVG